MTKQATQAHGKTQTANEPLAANAGQPGFKSWINHPKSVARLQILVIVLGVFVITGFIAVVSRIAYLTLYQPASENSAAPSSAPPSPRVMVPAASAALEQAIELPQGAIVQDIQPLSDGSVIVRFEDTRGTGMLVIDPASGAVLKKWRFVPAAN